MTTKRKKIVVMITRPAYGCNLGEVAWEVMVAASIFDQDISVIFSEDGIYQLKHKEQAEAVGLTNYRQNFPDLPGYGVDKIYIDKTSMTQRGIDANDLHPIASILNNSQLTGVLSQADCILTF